MNWMNFDIIPHRRRWSAGQASIKAKALRCYYGAEPVFNGVLKGVVLVEWRQFSDWPEVPSSIRNPTVLCAVCLRGMFTPICFHALYPLPMATDGILFVHFSFLKMCVQSCPLLWSYPESYLNFLYKSQIPSNAILHFRRNLTP